mmetsp:Transcript_85722/g.149648  ORF Transcript_85722/g.149648 Transcript_85722/m.149648 type:complete len:94 (+) Transcript_85722:798-1079(+)
MAGAQERSCMGSIASQSLTTSLSIQWHMMKNGKPPTLNWHASSSDKRIGVALVLACKQFMCKQLWRVLRGLLNRSVLCMEECMDWPSVRTTPY